MQLKLTSLSSVARSFIVVAAGVAAPSVALADGMVTAWGRNNWGQCNIPASANSGVSAIAGGGYHTIALKDGTDCDADSVSDTDEIAQDPTLDRNLNGVLDSCDIAANPAIDSNQNGILDSADIAAANALLATANAQVAALTAQLNCGDLNGDGEVNGADVGLQLINYGPCAP